MPMNLIKPYSGLNLRSNEHSIPLILNIDFDNEFSNIMNFVFGKVVVARSMVTIPFSSPVGLHGKSALECFPQRIAFEGPVKGPYLKLYFSPFCFECTE